MESLGSGESPAVNARVTMARKAQLQFLAKRMGVRSSDVVRDAIDAYVTAQMKNDPTLKADLIRIAVSEG